MTKTGGLGDVSEALPAALRADGVDAMTLLPGYPAVLDGVGKKTPVRSSSCSVSSARCCKQTLSS
jgi:starch synthase